MFGASTVARFVRSILLPVSSSMCENDATHFKKTKRISKVSRCAFGSSTVTMCKMRILSGSGSSTAKIEKRQQRERLCDDSTQLTLRADK